jgi:hypothetical protein
MKHPPPTETQTKFSGGLRHYHRSGAQSKRSWDDWVEGTTAKPKSNVNWLKIVGIAGAVLALGGIISGLVVEMR